jgi:hypothetical protein
MALYITGLIQALGFKVTSVRILTGTGHVQDLVMQDLWVQDVGSLGLRVGGSEWSSRHSSVRTLY